jgi:hypothetical protein
MSPLPNERRERLTPHDAYRAFIDADYAHFCAQYSPRPRARASEDIGVLRLTVAQCHADCVDAGIAVSSFTDNPGIREDYKRRYLIDFVAARAAKRGRITYRDRNLIAAAVGVVVAGIVAAQSISGGVSQESLTAGIIVGVACWGLERLAMGYLFPTPAEAAGMESIRIQGSIDYHFRNSAQDLAQYNHGRRMAKGLVLLREMTKHRNSRKD